MTNNVLLGNCQQVIQDQRNPEGLYFLSFQNEDGTLDCAIKVSPKIILSCKNPLAVQAIRRFFEQNSIAYQGVIGNRFAVEAFIKDGSRKVAQSRVTLVQSLSKVSELHLSQGSFEPARLSDVPLLKKWTGHFLEEENLLPKRSAAEMEQLVKNFMKQGSLFLWMQDEKPVSMAAIIRRTKHSAIVGFVYTPAQYRGEGFARSCVHQLSDYILRSGARHSGLLVYESNEGARKIYRQIGYRDVSTMLDVDFV